MGQRRTLVKATPPISTGRRDSSPKIKRHRWSPRISIASIEQKLVLQCAGTIPALTRFWHKTARDNYLEEMVGRDEIEPPGTRISILRPPLSS
jgi:hypothetical protein